MAMRRDVRADAQTGGQRFVPSQAHIRFYDACTYLKMPSFRFKEQKRSTRLDTEQLASARNYFAEAN